MEENNAILAFLDHEELVRSTNFIRFENTSGLKKLPVLRTAVLNGRVVTHMSRDHIFQQITGSKMHRQFCVVIHNYPSKQGETSFDTITFMYSGDNLSVKYDSSWSLITLSAC